MVMSMSVPTSTTKSLVMGLATEVINAGELVYHSAYGQSADLGSNDAAKTIVPVTCTAKNFYFYVGTNTLSGNLQITIAITGGSVAKIYLTGATGTTFNLETNMVVPAGAELWVWINAAAGTGSASDIRWGL